MTNNQENQTTGQTAAQGKADIFRATRKCVKRLRRKARKEARQLKRAAKAQFDKEASAALIIQCCARKYFCYQICLDLILDHMFMCNVLLIQRFARGAIARRNLAAAAAAAAAAATIIQRVVRGAVARTLVVATTAATAVAARHCAATTIQRFFVRGVAAARAANARAANARATNATVHVNMDSGNTDVEDVEDVEDVDVDVEIDEAVDGEKGAGNEDGDKDDTKIEKETEKMRFKEALDEIEALKVELNEVNLFNAKLLYTNKVFKSKNLSEDKKVKVLKAFDKASTVKEAKVIFETLNEGLVSKTEAIVRPKGAASKATGTITEAKKPIIESNDVYNRMRKLAGLI